MNISLLFFIMRLLQLIFNKHHKNTQWERIDAIINSVAKNWITIWKNISCLHTYQSVHVLISCTKMDIRPEIISSYKKTGEKIYDIGLSNDNFWYDTKSTDNKSKNEQAGLDGTVKFLWGKRNSWQN